MCYWDSATIPLQAGSSYSIDAYILAMNVARTGNLTVTVTSERDPSQVHSIVFTANVESFSNNQEFVTMALALTVAGIAIILAVFGVWAKRHRQKAPQVRMNQATSLENEFDS